MGIDFTIVPGKGPKILKPIASKSDITALKKIEDVESQVPFLGPILKVCYCIAHIFVRYHEHFEQSELQCLSDKYTMCDYVYSNCLRTFVTVLTTKLVYTTQTLRRETEGKTSLIGFIGAPWTLGAYSVEGGHSKLCTKFKRMCLEEPAMARTLLDTLTDSLCTYASYQVRVSVVVFCVYIGYMRVGPGPDTLFSVNEKQSPRMPSTNLFFA